MKLVIHDLTKEEWDRQALEYGECTVVSADGRKISPCAGCFGCWDKDPGRCVIKDGYGDMGYLIHHADEVVVISRYTFGGFSGFVKNVFDRSLGYVLPQFEIVKGESHHKKRYDEDKPFTFIFYGSSLSREEKDSAVRYVEAVCTNIRGYVRKVVFMESGERPQPAAYEANGRPGPVLLLNGSMRSANGNSAALAAQLALRLSSENSTQALRGCLNDMPALFPAVESAGALVLCVPLYVDGLPAQVVRFMEQVQREYRGAGRKVYVLANMGLYESGQLVNLFGQVRRWCEAVGFEYCGGLGVSAGELVGAMMKHVRFGSGVTRMAARGMVSLAEAIDSGAMIGDIYAQPWMFPRSLYIAVANTNWNRLARKNGISPKDLYRRL